MWTGGEILRCGERIYKKQFWFNEEEVMALKEKSSKAGMKECEFIRKILLGYELKEKPDERFYETIKQMRIISNNLNQIAKKAHALNYIDEVAYRKESENWHSFIEEVKDTYLVIK